MDILKSKLRLSRVYFTNFFLFFPLLIPIATSSQTIKASMFGYNEKDSTLAFKSAIESPNDTIIFDAGIWNIGPIVLSNISNKTIIFEPGVVVKSLPEKFKAFNASLFKMINCNNIEIIGYGAQFKMNKEEYVKYNDSEHRMSISLNGGDNLIINGLTIDGSGGDGIYITGTGKQQAHKPSKNILIQDCIIQNQYRQGISIISAENLLVKNCIFTKTNGVLPGSGVDVEPNVQYNKLKNINFVACSFTYNDHAGIQLSLSNLDIHSDAIDIKFSECYLSMNHSETNKYAAGEIVISSKDVSPVKGTVLFDKCFIDGSMWGFLFTRKSSDAFHVTFKDCAAVNICQSELYKPITLEVANYRSSSGPIGGFTFENLYLEYNQELPFLQIIGSRLRTLRGVHNLFGDITVKAPFEKGIFINYKNYSHLNNKNVDFNYTIIKSGGKDVITN